MKYQLIAIGVPAATSTAPEDRLLEIKFNANEMHRLASLTLLLLALRASAAEPPGAPGACAGDRRRPTITAITATTRSFKTPGQVLVLPYGEDLTIYCSGDDSADLEIEHNGRIGPVQLNSSTVFVSVSQPGVGEYIYRCTDRTARCAGALAVTVAPSISLASPQARHSIDDYGTLTYFVPRGEAYDVFCSGNDDENLRLEYRSSGIDGSGALRTSRAGPAAVRYVVGADKPPGGRLYTCTHRALQTVTRHQQITVIVDDVPEVKHFHCFFNNEHIMTCLWTNQNERSSSKLFITHKGKTRPLCVENLNTNARVCTSIYGYDHDEQYSKETSSFTLETCNQVYCTNQSFPFDVQEMKLSPPSKLRVVNVTSRSAVLRWREPRPSWSAPREYKVDYRMLVDLQIRQQVNTSTILCYGDQCEFEVELPCPDIHYELNLYVRVKEVIGETQWSVPTSIYFFTLPNEDDENYSVCSKISAPFIPLTTKEVIMYQVQYLRRDISKDYRRRLTSNLIKNLHLKLIKIQYLKREADEKLKKSQASDDDVPPRVVCVGLSRDSEFNHKLKRYRRYECSYSIDQY